MHVNDPSTANLCIFVFDVSVMIVLVNWNFNKLLSCISARGRELFNNYFWDNHRPVKRSGDVVILI